MLSNLKIKKCDDWAQWDDYISGHPNGTLYHLGPWKRVIEKTFNIEADYYVAQVDEKVCGVLPLFRIETFFNAVRIVSIPYAVYGGILADNPEIETALLEYAIDFTQKNNSNHIEFRCLHDANYSLPKQNLYVTYIKEIADTEEKILLNVPRKSRASIRSGLNKYGLLSEINKDYNSLYRLYLLNKRKLGSPAYPRIFFKNLLDEFGPKSNIIMTCYQKKEISGVLFFEFKNTLYPYFSGSDLKYNFTSASNVMYFDLMKYGLNNGFKFLDFGRSRIGTGAGKFKENMGFIAQPLHYYHYLTDNTEIPNMNPSNQKFALISRMWMHLPLPITEYLGPKIVKRIP